MVDSLFLPVEFNVVNVETKSIPTYPVKGGCSSRKVVKVWMMMKSGTIFCEIFPPSLALASKKGQGVI